MTSDDEEVRRRVRERYLQAQQQQLDKEAAFGNAIQDAYQNPESARKGMEKVAARGGVERLVTRLREVPQVFGLRRGHPLSTDGWKHGARERGQLAKSQLARLPNLARELAVANGKVKDARSAYELAGGPAPTAEPASTQQKPAIAPAHSPDQQRPSFSRDIEQAQATKEADPVRRENERAATLERWRRGREDDKERGR